MQHHFITPYTGNKRREVINIHDHIKDNLDGIDTIIEPFCGSSAVSYYLSTIYPKRFKYILNDLDPMLIELYHLMMDKYRFDKFELLFNETVKLIVNKESYLKITKPQTFLAWFIRNKIYGFHIGIYRPNYKPKTYDLNKYGIVKFLREENVEITLGDGMDLVKQYENNPNILFILDPPYLNSCNSFYTNQTTNVYDYCADKKINNFNSKMVFILEDIPVIRELFLENIKLSYKKHYELKHKNTEHIIISNLG